MAGELWDKSRRLKAQLSQLELLHSHPADHAAIRAQVVASRALNAAPVAPAEALRYEQAYLFAPTPLKNV
jgi:hypothetical protein